MNHSNKRICLQIQIFKTHIIYNKLLLYLTGPNILYNELYYNPYKIIYLFVIALLLFIIVQSCPTLYFQISGSLFLMVESDDILYNRFD